MAKVFKRDSSVELKVQEVEKLMESLGITIHGNCLYLVIDGVSVEIVGEEGSTAECFPRITDDQRLRLPEIEKTGP